jgi:hypothetical protein
MKCLNRVPGPKLVRERSMTESAREHVRVARIGNCVALVRGCGSHGLAHSVDQRSARLRHRYMTILPSRQGRSTADHVRRPPYGDRSHALAHVGMTPRSVGRR